jgi:hypothetical protein
VQKQCLYSKNLSIEKYDGFGVINDILDITRRTFVSGGLGAY